MGEIFSSLNQSFGAYFPRLNLWVILFLLLVLYFVFFDVNFRAGGLDIDVSGRREKIAPNWKVGLFHTLVGGFAVSKLFAFFGALGLAQSLMFVVRLISPAQKEFYQWLYFYFGSAQSIGFYIFGLLFSYFGLWLGVKFSLQTIKKIFAPERGRPIIIWSAAFFIFFIILGIISHYLLASGRDIYSRQGYNFFDALMRLVLFVALSKWYMYRLVITRRFA